MTVKTNMGKTFPKLLQLHFPKGHPMHKIFHRNMLKISYCCLRNMESIIMPHNKQILNPSKEYFGCSCRVLNECHLDNKYLTSNIVYKEKVSNKTNNQCKRYLAASETPFRNHTRDFKHKKYEKCTEHSKYSWTLKFDGITPIVRWIIVKRVNSKTAANYCKLSLTETFYIIQYRDDKLC